jgi:hypothetical protein
MKFEQQTCWKLEFPSALGDLEKGFIEIYRDGSDTNSYASGLRILIHKPKYDENKFWVDDVVVDEVRVDPRIRGNPFAYIALEGVCRGEVTGQAAKELLYMFIEKQIESEANWIHTWFPNYCQKHLELLKARRESTAMEVVES